MKVTGILNVTPNSFSDGNDYMDPQQALNNVHHMIESGMQVIDIGAEATNPKISSLIDSHEELKRLAPVLEAIYPILKQHNIEISIDSRHVDTISYIANHYHIDIVNDQSSGSESGMIKYIAEHKHLQYVIMHHLTLPTTPDIRIPDHEHPIEVITHYLADKIETLKQHGIEDKRIILDPGIGFGKTADHSSHILGNLEQLMQHFPRHKFMIGHSRKSFLKHLLPDGIAACERDLETAIITSWLTKYSNQIEYLRVHNVNYTMRAIKLAKYMEQCL